MSMRQLKIRAAGRFDHTKGFKFISFAVWWIRQSILQALGDNSRMIRLPANKIMLKKQVYSAQSVLEQELNRTMQFLTERQKQTICYFFGIGIDHPLTLEDIGCKFDLTPERVRQIRDKALLKMRATKSTELLRVFL